MYGVHLKDHLIGDSVGVTVTRENCVDRIHRSALKVYDVCTLCAYLRARSDLCNI